MMMDTSLSSPELTISSSESHSRMERREQVLMEVEMIVALDTDWERVFWSKSFLLTLLSRNAAS